MYGISLVAKPTTATQNISIEFRLFVINTNKCKACKRVQVNLYLKVSTVSPNLLKDSMTGSVRFYT